MIAVLSAEVSNNAIMCARFLILSPTAGSGGVVLIQSAISVSYRIQRLCSSGAAF